ncbi:hypothetical protein PVAND_003452 [Polypedilum vanderplanki]|uniref:Uncharacterized protein n=1 Tax=Polypedilum vanderplanki TaxID=319348 RepID=A0A9J6BV43_POLVA|nr:hypothetical protein PVAND_003452 [Polypedilum vanderplanki]
MPPKVQKQATLASILSDPVKLKQWISENPGADRIRTFLLHRSQLKTELFCGTCERDIAETPFTAKINDRELLDGTDNFIWCVTCDSLEHLSCNATHITDQQAPWICEDCKRDPNNEAAMELVEDGRVGHKIERRLLSLKAEPADPYEYEELMTFFTKSLNIDFINGTPDLKQLKLRFEEQKEEAEKLGQNLNEAHEKISSLVASLEAQTDELAQLRQESIKRSNRPDNVPLNRNASPTPKRRVPFMTYAADFGMNADPTAASTKVFKKPSSADSSPLDKTIEVMEKMELHQLRQILPIVKEYNGDYSKWLTFERQVNLVQSEGGYNGQYMKYIIRDKLTGTAADFVDGLMDTLEWEEIMDHLRNAFGNPTLVVDAKRKEVQKIKLPAKLTHAAVVEAKTIVAGYIQACRQAKIQPHDRSLALFLYNQLDARHCEGYYAFFKQHHPFETREEKLDVLIEYLDSIRDTLPPGIYSNISKDAKSKDTNNSFQLSSISAGGTSSNASSSSQQNTSRSANSRARTDSYEIRSLKEAKYMGYDMDKLRTYPAHCVLCSRDGHYTVECRAYKKKTLEERQRFVESKQLCQSCIISADHQANQCTLKKCCGARIGMNRCAGKHHVSLHKQNFSKTGRRHRPGSNRNKPDNNSFTQSNKPAETKTSSYQGHPVNTAKGDNGVLFTNLPKQGFQLLTLSSNSSANIQSSPRTIKLFRTVIQYNGKCAAAFTVGDSAAEISLVKRSLVDALGITGEPAVIGIQWTDNTTKNITGIKVDIPIKGILPDSEEFWIKDCYAVDDFTLPARSLNVELLKEKYPYLSSIPFASYRNAVPAVLLGARHASLVEAVKPVWEDGEGKPIGILTKLGYSIYGLSSNEHQLDVLNALAEEIDSDGDESITNAELSKQYEVSVSLDSLHLKTPGTHLTADEKSAITQAEAGLKQLPDGRIQMPLIWRLVKGSKPKLPDNFALVLRRQLAQERKLSKNPELLEAFNNNFKAEIDDGFIRGATKADLHTTGNVNYVPMSLVVNPNKRPIKTRNVYDASAKYKNTSLNANLLPGPNLLIDLLKPIMAMQECTIAFTGDIKAMFNQIMIDPVDQNCQRILW